MRSIFWEVYYLGHSNKHSGSCLKLQKIHCKGFWWEHIKNENHKSYSRNKKQRLNFLVVSRSGAVWFCLPLFSHPLSDAKLKPNSPKIGRNEIKFVLAYKLVAIPPKKACIQERGWACPRSSNSYFIFFSNFFCQFSIFSCHKNFIIIFHWSISSWTDAAQI